MTNMTYTVQNDSAVVRELTAEEALALFRSLSDEEKRKALAFIEGMKNGNFDQATGRKIREVCDCWVLGKPFNCGYDECPGYKLRAILMKKEKSIDT